MSYQSHVVPLDQLPHPRPAPSPEALLRGATSRILFVDHEGKSGARLERLVIDGRPYVAKHLVLADDWIRRATGDLGCRAIRLWEFGLYDALPSCLDAAVAGCARMPATPDGVMLLHDVGDWLVPDGTAVVPLDQHRRFVEHLAALHAAFWAIEDDIELFGLPHRLVEFAPCTYEAERALGHDPLPPRLAVEGWQRLAVLSPPLAGIVLPLLDDPTPLASALRRLPQTLVHGNWKYANLGSHPDGRTILLDWESTGVGPATLDLAWFLAINCARMPESKEATIDSYQAALGREGVDLEPWWPEALSLGLIGAFCQLGWEKALGDRDDEFAWWEEQVVSGSRWVS